MLQGFTDAVTLEWGPNVAARGSQGRAFAAEVMFKMMAPFMTHEVGIREKRVATDRGLSLLVQPTLSYLIQNTELFIWRKTRPALLKLSSHTVSLPQLLCVTCSGYFSLKKPRARGEGVRKKDNM